MQTSMRNNGGFDILVNGVTRTFHDAKAHTFNAAQLPKSTRKGDIVEIIDRSTGSKVMMLEDGRTA